MSAPFQTVIRTAALIGKYQTPEVAESLLALADFLRERGVGVLVEESAAPALLMHAHDHETASFETIGARADVAIVLGGDGTLLAAARRLAEFGVPLTGINQGRLGFMTDIARDDMLSAMDDLLGGRFTAEPRILLDAEVLREGRRVFHSLALNDVVVRKGDIGRLIEMNVAVDGEFLHVLRADGVIVATPTGSTAYALSANGPILYPAVPGIALVPLCPHALSYRPITLSDQNRIELTLVPPNEAVVHFDGQGRFDAHAGDCVRVTRSRHVATLLHPPGYSYFAMLREKLHWSAAPKH
ncbi:MAG: NAD(+)/NADH kinase [Candidatus Nitricoxidivorans perseverans]|uniref:NAD kinase n=1 Tax=Candidatus Nitricoxidivorans perseverans TaxID=2975601 RepID=A0AA49FLB5_9PROT|nr:MAG: NAD(+)/NADH kinase [Candidatus Nitricoxidivorans perseverans]